MRILAFSDLHRDLDQAAPPGRAQRRRRRRDRRRRLRLGPRGARGDDRGAGRDRGADRARPRQQRDRGRAARGRRRLGGGDGAARRGRPRSTGSRSSASAPGSRSRPGTGASTSPTTRRPSGSPAAPRAACWSSTRRRTGHVDASSAGDHLGSAAILAAIEAKQPRLAVCGHIHESWGERSRIGETEVAQPRPATEPGSSSRSRPRRRRHRDALRVGAQSTPQSVTSSSGPERRTLAADPQPLTRSGSAQGGVRTMPRPATVPGMIRRCGSPRSRPPARSRRGPPSSPPTPSRAPALAGVLARARRGGPLPRSASRPRSAAARRRRRSCSRRSRRSPRATPRPGWCVAVCATAGMLAAYLEPKARRRGLRRSGGGGRRRLRPLGQGASPTATSSTVERALALCQQRRQLRLADGRLHRLRRRRAADARRAGGRTSAWC